MPKKNMNNRKNIFTAVIAIAILSVAGFGQIKSDSSSKSQPAKEVLAKQQLSEIPMLTAQTTVGKVGEKIRIYGAQFRPNETVNVVIEKIDASTSLRQNVDYFTNYADENGNLIIQWTMPDQGRYVIGAIGSESEKATYRVIDSLSATRTLVQIAASTYTCTEVNANNAQFPNVTSNWGFKIDETADTANPSGTFPLVNSAGPPPTVLTGGAPADAGNSITANFNASKTQLTWSATRPITAVIVKGGNGGVNVYRYDPYSLSDDGSMNGVLTTTTNQAISHVEFCFSPLSRILVRKQASPPSDFQFQFGATGLLTTNFTLVDNSSTTDPMIQFMTTPGVKTITEINPSPYQLVSINCVSMNGTSTINSVTVPTANVTLGEGDTVICTFNNDFTTATEATITGRVVDAYGNAVKDAIVAATDSNGTVVTARTNQFGRYTMTVEGGLSLYMSVSRKGYSFPSQLVNVSDSSMTVNFTGQMR